MELSGRVGSGIGYGYSVSEMVINMGREKNKRRVRKGRKGIGRNDEKESTTLKGDEGIAVMEWRTTLCCVCSEGGISKGILALELLLWGA